MELFSLLAKLTLDTKEYDKSISEAEKAAKGMTIEEPKLGLDTSEFESGISEVENTDVDLDDPELGLDNSEFNDNLDESQDKASSFGDAVGSTFTQLKGVIAAAGIAGVVAGIVSSLKEGVDLARTHGDMIDKQSQKMNISAKAYQEWAYALDLSGANIDDLNRGLRTWQQSVGDEEAIGKMSDAFNALGIDAETAFKKIESGENLDQLLNQVMYGLADYSGGDRGAIVEALFGKNANGLNALFNQTAEDIRNAKQEAEDLGMIMSDEEVKNAANYNDAVTRLQGALNGIKEAFAGSIIPLLTDAANTVAKIVAFFNPRNNQKTLSEMFGDSEGKFAEELVDIEGTAAAAETLADKLLAMGDTSKMTAEQYAIWKGTAEELIELVPSLGEVIDTESGQINANSEEIKENIKQWENLAKQKALQTLKEEKLAAIAEKQKDLVEKSIDVNRKAAETEKARVESLSKINTILTANGQDALDANATLQDVFDAQTKLVTDNPYDTALQINMGNAIQEWTSANAKAVDAQQELDNLNKEVAEGQQEYEEWLAAAESLYGGLDQDASDATSKAMDLKRVIDSLPGRKTIELVTPRLMQYAIGSDYIPYDQMAILHRGERVLTATEARQERSAGGDFSGLEDKIEAAIRRGIEGATVRSYLNGRDITDEVNRQNINAVKGRRFSG